MPSPPPENTDKNTGMCLPKRKKPLPDKRKRLFFRINVIFLLYHNTPLAGTRSSIVNDCFNDIDAFRKL